MYDPDNPENARNDEFIRFVQAFEIDANGNTVSGPLALDAPLPPFSELRMRFSEPMSADSISAYENFQVRFEPDQGPGSEILSQATVDARQTTVIVRPALEDQAAGTFQIVGWGRNVKSLRFSLTIVPKTSYLQKHMSADAVDVFLDQGFRGMTDLGGQPIAFPDSVFDPVNPAITFSIPFTTDETKSTQIPPPVVQSWGVMVHRMQGRPITGVDPATGEPGVKYVDQVNYYRPIADVNLQTNGYLAGSPVVYITQDPRRLLPAAARPVRRLPARRARRRSAAPTRRPVRRRTTARASRRCTATSTARRAATRSRARCSTSTG